MRDPPLVYVVDDDQAVREALSLLFESAGFSVRPCPDGEAFLAGYDPARPCCLLLDLHMPGTGGLELQEALRARGRSPPIIFLTGHGDVPAAVRALQQGAADFVQKPLRDHEALIERVARCIDEHARALQAAAARTALRERLALLTPREREVLDAVCAGRANKVIAADLGISERTVELHRGRLMRKLRARSVAELVRMQEAVNES